MWVSVFRRTPFLEAARSRSLKPPRVLVVQVRSPCEDEYLAMLAYLATKEQFLKDAPVIEDIVKDNVYQKLNLRVGESEFNAWRNSLGNAMAHVMHSDKIPSDSGVSY